MGFMLIDFFTKELTAQSTALCFQIFTFKHTLILAAIQFIFLFIIIKIILSYLSKYKFIRGYAFTLLTSSVLALIILQVLEKCILHGFIFDERVVVVDKYTIYTPMYSYFGVLIILSIIVYFGIFAYGFWKMKYRRILTVFMADVYMFVDNTRAKFDI